MWKLNVYIYIYEFNSLYVGCRNLWQTIIWNWKLKYIWKMRNPGKQRLLQNNENICMIYSSWRDSGAVKICHIDWKDRCTFVCSVNRHRRGGGFELHQAVPNTTNCVLLIYICNMVYIWCLRNISWLKL
jgi:hypothetical protein